MTVLMLPMARHGEMMASTHGTAGHGPAQTGPDARQASTSTSTDGREKTAPSIAEAMQILDTSERATALRAAGAEAARKDPAEAISLTASFTSEQDKLEFLRGIYSVWGDTDPVAALSHANANFPAGIARSETIGIAINTEHLSDEVARVYLKETGEAHGLPCVDPIRTGVASIIDELIRRYGR